MPETYLDNSVVGFDPNSNLRFQVDTYNRLSPILNLEDKPMFTGNEPSALRDNFATAKGGKRPELPDISITDALSSQDPVIQDMGRTSMEEWMQKNVPEYRLGLGREVDTPYEQGKKYLNKDYGFSKMRDNEDFYYKNVYMDSSWFGRNFIKNPLRFLGRLVGGALAKVGESFGYMGSMITSIGSDNYFEKVADNGFSKWFENQEETLKNDLIPVYKQAGFDDKGFFSRLGDWSFWNDDVADAGAFMASAILQTVATDGLGNLMGLGKVGSLGINTASKLGKFGRGVDGTIKFLTGADDVAGIANHAFNTASESFFESAGVFKETKQDLLDARRRGENNYSDDQISKIASQRAASDFKGNLMALTLSNAFENRYIFQPFKKFLKGSTEGGSGLLGRTRATIGEITGDTETSLAGKAVEFKYSTKAGKLFDWKNPQSRLRFYGGRAITSSLVEGLYEENVQLAMERMARYGEYEKRNSINSILATVGKTASQTREAIRGNDKEASISIGLGALIGVLGTGAVGKLFGGKRFFQGERSAEIERAEAAIDNYNILRKQFLSTGDVYKKDDKGNYEIDENGSMVYDEAKVQARADGLTTALKKTVLADQISNPVHRKMLQDDMLSDLVHASISAGLGESFLNRLKGLHTKSASEIAALGFNPAEVKATPEQLISDVEALMEMHKKAFETSTLRPKGVSSKDYTNNEELRKTYLYKAGSLGLSAKNAHSTFEAAMTEQSASHPVSDDNDAAVQEHNLLTFQLAGLQAYEKLSKQNGNFYADHIKERKADILQRQKDIKDSLKDKIDTSSLVDKDGLLMSPKAGELYDNNSLDLSIQQSNATSKNAQLQWEYVASQLSSTIKGHENFMKFKDHLASMEKNDEKADEQPHTVKKNPDGTFSVVTPSGEATPQSFKTEAAAQAAADEYTDVEDDEEEDETPTTVTTPVPPAPAGTQTVIKTEDEGIKDDDTVDLGEDTAEGVEFDSGVDRVPDEIDSEKPVTFWNPNITSKRDTDNVSTTEEKLTTDDYSLMRGELIKKFIDGNNSFSDNYKLFIVKDAYPEVYQKQTGTPIVKEDNGKWVFIDQNQIGEVVVLRHIDGSTAKVSDFFPDSFKDIGDLPIIFSFDKTIFFGELYNPQRLPLKASKAKISIAEADDENKAWRKEADDAREEVATGKKSEVEVKLYHSTGGINPKTTTTTVQQRFGDFTFDVATPVVKGQKGGNTQFDNKYYPGTIVIKIGNTDFPAFTSKLSSYPEIYSKVQAALSYKFPTLEEATAVRNDFLDIMVNSNDTQFFTIEKEGITFIINFRKAREEDIGTIPKAEVRRNGIISNTLIGDVNLNVSSKAVKSGYRDFNPITGESEFLDKDAYITLIKPKLMTNLKRVTDKEGNLYMETVNPYFSFLVVGAVKTQKNNYDALKNRINTLIASNQLDMETISKGLSSELNDGNITPEQMNELRKLAESYVPPPPSKVEEEKTQIAIDFYATQKKLLKEGSISQGQYDMLIKVRLRNNPGEEALHKKSLEDTPPKTSEIAKNREWEDIKNNVLGQKTGLYTVGNGYQISMVVTVDEGEAYYELAVKKDGNLVPAFFDNDQDVIQNLTETEVLVELNRIEQKINTELAASKSPKLEEPKKEEPKLEKPKPVSDKYKNKDTKTVSNTLRNEGDKTSPYVVQDKYVYSPGENRFSYAVSGRKVPDSYLPNILPQMAEKYPYRESAGGNQGFGVFTEENVTIYRPPTPIASPEIVVIDGKIASLEEARKAVAGKTNLEEFLKKYCK